MKTVICKRYAGKPLTTAQGVIQFDSNGLVELEDEAADKLTTIPGFNIYAAESNDGGQGDKEHSTDPGHAESGKGGTQEGENGGTPDEGEQPNKDDNPGEGENGSEDEQPNEGKDSSDESDKPGEDTTKKNTEGGADELDIEALKKLNVMSLKSLAKKRGLNIEGLSKKDEFINLLTKTPAAE